MSFSRDRSLALECTWARCWLEILAGLVESGSFLGTSCFPCKHGVSVLNYLRQATIFDMDPDTIFDMDPETTDSPAGSRTHLRALARV